MTRRTGSRSTTARSSHGSSDGSAASWSNRYRIVRAVRPGQSSGNSAPIKRAANARSHWMEARMNSGDMDTRSSRAERIAGTSNRSDHCWSVGEIDVATELAHVQLIIEATRCEQLIMRAALHVRPGLYRQHLVGVADRAQAVRDHERRPATQQLLPTRAGSDARH